MKLTLLLTLLLAGCSLSPSAEFIDALGRDQSNLCVKLNAVYGVGNGNVLYSRANCVNCTVKCNQDGLSVTSGEEK